MAVGAGLVGWSVTGLRPDLLNRWTDGPERWGIALVGVGLVAGLIASVATDAGPALAVLVAGWLVAGIGMGFAYARISSTAVADLAPDRLFPVATAVEFAETSGTALAAFVGGGTYSLARSMSADPTASLGWAFALLIAAAVTGLVVAAQKGSRTP